MNDKDFILAIAKEWIRLGGDAEGVAWNWRHLQECIQELEEEEEGSEEYEEYKERREVYYPDCPLLSYGEFCYWVDQWNEKYDAAWKHPAGIDYATIDLLEMKLCV